MLLRHRQPRCWNDMQGIAWENFSSFFVSLFRGKILRPFLVTDVPFYMDLNSQDSQSNLTKKINERLICVI